MEHRHNTNDKFNYQNEKNNTWKIGTHTFICPINYYSEVERKILEEDNV